MGGRDRGWHRGHRCWESGDRPICCGVTRQSCPSPGLRPRTAARQAQPALPRPPLIGVISHKYFPRSQQRFDNKQTGERKGLTVASPIPSSEPGSERRAKPGFARGGTEASAGRMRLAPELGAGRARRLFREHLGMTQCLLLSMRVMSMPRSRHFTFRWGCGLQHSEHGKTAGAGSKNRQNHIDGVQNSKKLQGQCPNLKNLHRQRLKLGKTTGAVSKTRPPSSTAGTKIAKGWDNLSCSPGDTCSTSFPSLVYWARRDLVKSLDFL